MSLTKTQARDLIRQFLDDAGAKLWSDTYLDLLATIELDRLWGGLLEFRPDLLSQLDELATLTTPGFIRTPLTTDTPAGDLSQRLFRIQTIVRNDQVFSEINPKRLVIMDDEVIMNDSDTTYTWFKYGTRIYLLPLDTDDPVEFRYSYLPAKFTSLGVNDPVVWPEGYELAYVLRIAGLAMLKGEREDSSNLLAQAEVELRDLRSAIQKPGGGVIMPFGRHGAISFGGE